MLEKFIAGILLIFLSPIFLLIFLLILLLSGKPIIYKHKRYGYNFEVFKIIKFRTMYSNSGPPLTSFGDKRITFFGRFLRKFKLDELPQLINILKGEMGFIGPRPEAIEIVNNNIEIFSYLNKIKPGVTDINSIIFKDEAKIFKNFNINNYENDILPIKSHLVNLTFNNLNLLKKVILAFLSIISVLHHNFALQLIQLIFLPNLEQEFKIKLNNLLLKQIF
tara:strand:+ start:92 stop:754 length:663 start_codon:yes stop_codon:yes gene_type:complete